jgi:uncharacterized membrane protein
VSFSAGKSSKGKDSETEPRTRSIALTFQAVILDPGAAEFFALAGFALAGYKCSPIRIVEGIRHSFVTFLAALGILFGVRIFFDLK